MLGNALKELDEKKRAKVIVGSKIQPFMCYNVRKECEDTLKRLQLECIDLYMVHWPISKNSIANKKEIPSTKKTFEVL